MVVSVVLFYSVEWTGYVADARGPKLLGALLEKCVCAFL